ncbi:MAG: GNAT family N-acetyltransferase [Burkholderiales bacterium]|nr:GNAT family N-acetyltransferase [Burkholderiales bacterium]
MPSYQVRPAVLRDADAVAAIHAASSHAAYEGLVPDQHQSLPMEKRRAFWRDAIEYSEPQVHLAMDGDTAVGFVGFDRSRDPKSKNTTGEIWAIYVLPSHWNQGAGLALWDATREGLIEEGCTEVTLWIPLANNRALRFFELAGFKRETSTARTAVLGGVKLEEIRLKRKLD